MSVNVSSSGDLADIEISNSSRVPARHDASSSIDQGSADAAFARSRNAATGMALNRGSNNLQNEGDRSSRATDQTASLTQSGRQSSDGLLQVPSDAVNPRPPIGTAVWDWDADLDLIGESNNYYYEPQGELLQVEQREHGQSRNEFSIPHAVAGSRGQRPTADEEGFIVPQRPNTTAQSLAGNKRKSSSEASGSGKQPEPKRSSRMMSETTEGETPPSDTVSAPSNTLPPRMRSQTDTTESRGRPDLSSFAGGRPGHGPSGLRRTLTEPTIPMVLPARKVFPIQIGDKLFRLSGASISSDGKHCLHKPFSQSILTLQEPLPISHNSSKSSYGRMRALIV